MIVRPRSNAPQAIPWIGEAAAFQRFDPSPDERRLAAVVQARDGQELRIYDVGEGRSQAWLRAPYIGHALWSPRGDHLAVHLGEESTSVLVLGSPDVARAPDTLVHGSGTSPAPDPMSWRSDSVLIARAGGTVLGLDPRSRTPRVDTLVSDADFPDLSPDGRFLLYGRLGTGGMLITPFPSRNTLSQANEGMEAQWASMTAIRYSWGGREMTWFDVSVDSATGHVRGAPRVYFTDTLFADTPGRSSRPVSNGGMIYLQAPVRATGTYLRVVPHWVEKMKRAVDSADASRD
jgi:hypothetical protein